MNTEEEETTKSKRLFGLARKPALAVGSDEEEYPSGCCVKRKLMDGGRPHGLSDTQELRGNEGSDGTEEYPSG